MQMKKVKAWQGINPAGAIAVFTSKVKAYEWATMGGLVSQTFVHKGV